jgi:hypothetical protein
MPTVWVGLDEDNPPIFESQAAYLKRAWVVVGW